MRSATHCARRSHHANAVLAALVLLVGLVVTSIGTTVAGASTVPYGTFGNLTYNDCQYEAAANLVLDHDPHAKITTAEVVAAYKANGINGPEGTPEGLDYAESVGFDGWRIATATPITGEAAIIAAANGNGVYVTLGWGHAVDIVHANTKKLDVIDDGSIPPMTWSNWHAMYASPGTVYYSITWMPQGSVAVSFESSTTSDSPNMPAQIEHLGATVPLAANMFLQDGYEFMGWSTKSVSNNGGAVQYRDGQDYTFTKGATLYAVWTYCGTNCPSTSAAAAAGE